MAWLAAVTKLAPHVLQITEIAISAIPHLTRRKGPDAPAIADKATQQQQIDELQEAATQNADFIRKLANDLQLALSAIEDGGEILEARFRRLEILAYSALALSALSVAAVLALWLGR
jgi:hypothetical protein